MAGYATKVKRDIARWVEAGHIDAATGAVLSRDIDSHGSRVNLGSVLSIMAATLFAAAVLIFIAANWEVIPRLVRAAMLFVVIAVGYVGGAMAKSRDLEALGEGAWIVAAAAFGASIALIAQMYHLSGDEKEALLVWCAATALAAAALRSGPLTVGAALIAAGWMQAHAFASWRIGELPLLFLALAAALYALSFWTRSVAARHVLLLSVYWFVCLVYARNDLLFGPALLAGLSVALFAAGHVAPVEARRWTGLGAGLSVQALLGFLAGIGVIQFELADESGFALVSAIALAGIVAVLLLHGRDSAPLRWLAYAAFVFQLCFLYLVMLGTMLDTAGFFAVGGLALSALAFLITRLERRLSGPPAAAGGVT